MENKNSAKIMFLYFISFISIACIIVIVFITIQSSQEQRNMEIDGNTVGKLETIERELNIYFDLKMILPKDLGELVENSDSLNGDDILYSDVKKEFEYIVKDEFSYELCADFKTSNKGTEAIYLNYDERWGHDIGRECFDRVVNFKVQKDVLDKKRKIEIEAEKKIRREKSGGVILLK